MDTPKWEFTAIAKKLIAELQSVNEHLKSLHDEIKNHSKTIDTARKRDENQGNIQPVWFEPVLTEYKKAEGDRKAEEDRQYCVQNSLRWAAWFTFGATLLAFSAAAYYAAIAKGQLRQMRVATKAAEKANADAWALADRANQTAIDSERPWVGITFTLGPDLDANTSQSIVYFVNSGETASQSPPV